MGTGRQRDGLEPAVIHLSPLVLFSIDVSYQERDTGWVAYDCGPLIRFFRLFASFIP
jgi:hypothetical protein